MNRWTVESGRSLCYDGTHAFNIAANAPGVGMPPAGLDGMAHRVAALLNAADTDPEEVLRTHVYGPDHPAQRQVIEELVRHPAPEVWRAAQDLGNALNLWPTDD